MNQHEDPNQPEDLNEPGESFAELERYLTQALRRVDAPKGFAERTMARAQQGATPRGKLLMMPTRLRVWTSGAIAAAFVAGVFLGDQMHVRRERQRTEAARQQFEAAMQITNDALDQARQHLRQAGVEIGN